MSNFKYHNHPVYILPDIEHKFGTERDMVFYCNEHGIDPKSATKFDSNAEYERWLELLQQQGAGLISELRRQVPYELTAVAYGEPVLVKVKKVKDWIVENEHFATQKEAHAYCKKHQLQTATAFCVVKSEPVYKRPVEEQPSYYIADFVYKDEAGNEIVEDVKSKITVKDPLYIQKRKCMRDKYGIRINQIIR